MCIKFDTWHIQKNILMEKNKGFKSEEIANAENICIELHWFATVLQSFLGGTS